MHAHEVPEGELDTNVCGATVYVMILLLRYQYLTCLHAITSYNDCITQ
jgi:hypothetical protein